MTNPHDVVYDTKQARTLSRELVATACQCVDGAFKAKHAEDVTDCLMSALTLAVLSWQIDHPDDGTNSYVVRIQRSVTRFLIGALPIDNLDWRAKRANFVIRDVVSRVLASAPLAFWRDAEGSEQSACGARSTSIWLALLYKLSRDCMLHLLLHISPDEAEVALASHQEERNGEWYLRLCVDEASRDQTPRLPRRTAHTR